MKVIGLVNQKGGVAKTTTTSALAAGLVKKDKRVLAIDYDPQGNLTASFGVELKKGQMTSFEFTKCDKSREAGFEDCVVKCSNGVHLIPASIVLAEAEVFLTSKMGREHFLKNAIAAVKGKYDYCLIDSPPSLSVLTINVLTACNEIIVPLKPEYLSLEGIKSLMNTVADIKQFCNPSLKVNGFLATMVDKRRTSTAEAIEMLEDYARSFKSKIYEAKIRAAVAVADAPSYGQSILEYSPASPVAQDYFNFVAEFLEA